MALVSQRLNRMFDYFSVDILVKTLFSPFRQISAGRVNGPLGIQLRAFVDRLISRLIGAMIRTAVLVFGVITIILTALFGLFELVLWAVLPILPFIGIVLAVSGWAF